MSELPSISVVMPIWNEAGFIEKSLGAMLSQDYGGLTEVICVDGMSNDGTRQIIMQMMEKDPRIRLVDNPRRIIPAALNRGIKAARYEYVARMDGHALASRDYLSMCVDVMQESGAACVGGGWEYVGETYMQNAIAAAMDSQFAVGTATWRGAKPGEADTVPYGFFRREELLKLGGYDETLLVNEDYELMWRIRQRGGRIVFSPRIRSEYFPRRTLTALIRQYFRYGLWKNHMLRKHPESAKVRHLLAPLFVAGLVAGGLMTLSGLWLIPLIYASALGVYVLLSLAFSVRQASRYGLQYLPVLPLIFLMLHVAWGSGFWLGVVRWWLLGQGSRSVT